MKKLTILICITALTAAMMLLYASPSFANKPNGPSASNGLSKGNSDVQHLELYEKDTSWNPVVGGARGRLTFDSDSFTFNGHGLVPGTAYSLIVYPGIEDPNPWPGSGPVLGSGIADDEGNIHLSDDMPTVTDAKVWLVTSSDCNGDGTMSRWNPSDYLFEYDTISN